MKAKPFAITLDPGSSLANRTGSWRTVRPEYVDRLPPCNHACPAGENIQGWLFHAEAGEYEQAWRLLTQDNPLPATMGRVCYHPCETACNRGELDECVGINALYQRDPDWAAPVLWRSEFRNVLATQVRRRSLTLELATALQAEAEDLMAGREYQVPSADVLRIAAESGCSAYDCEYVLLARQINVPLVTSDQAMLAAFPGTAVPLAD